MCSMSIISTNIYDKASEYTYSDRALATTLVTVRDDGVDTLPVVDDRTTIDGREAIDGGRA